MENIVAFAQLFVNRVWFIEYVVPLASYRARLMAMVASLSALVRACNGAYFPPNAPTMYKNCRQMSPQMLLVIMLKVLNC